MMKNPSHYRQSAVAIVGTTFLLLSAAGCAASQGGADGQVADAELVSQLPAASGPVDEISWNLVAGEPVTLDPRNSVSYSSGQVVSNLCDSLLIKDSDFEVSPHLATVEQTSPTEIVVDLRDDATFWDGSPVTAADVVYSLQRSADPENSVVAYAFDGVTDMTIDGDGDIVITFAQPDAQFMSGLSTIAGQIIKKDWAEVTGDAIGTPEGGLMCSGPFVLDSWEPGASITMTANEDYWDAEAVPLAKKVVFSFVTDTTAATQAMSAGELDGGYELPPSVIPNLSKAESGELHFGLSTQTFGLSVANPDGVMADPDLRRALQIAIDREAVADAVFYGAATPSYTLLSTTTWPNASKGVYEEAYEEFVEDRAFDVEEAKSLVEKSGYDGETIVLAITAGNETESKVAQLVQQQAKAIGLTVEIEALQPLVAAQANYDASARVGLDLLLGSSFNSSQEPLEPLFFTVMPEQPYNYTGFEDEEVIDLLTRARQEFDPEAQAELVVQAQEIFEAADITMPLVEMRTTTFLKNGLTGAVTSFAYWNMPQMASIGAE